MIEIPLTQGKLAMIDDTDFDLISQYKYWQAECRPGSNNWYATTQPYKDGKQVRIWMHRLILGLDRDDKRKTDHKDGNGLNNQRYNLRICTDAENQHNKRIQKGRRFKGVKTRTDAYRRKPYSAVIVVNNKPISLGDFEAEEIAARVYDVAALVHFGEFARLNFDRADYGE
jgi:hypothetical protein